MVNSLETSQLLVGVVSLLGRMAFPEDRLRPLVAPSERSGRFLAAYNLCDGTRSRSEVYKEAKLDKDNFNKAVKKWIAQGILFEIKDSDRPVLLHLYALPGS